MHIRTRKFVAAITGIVFAVVGVLWAFLGQGLADSLANLMIERQAGGDWTTELPDSGSAFYVYLVIGLCCASGISIAAMLWERRPNYLARFTSYATLLACLLPASVYNYAHFDMLVNRTGQALLNLYLIFGGTLVIMHLYSLRPSARDLLVLQVAAIFLLSLCSVLLPSTFSTLWFLNQVGAISLKTAETIGLPTLSTVTGIVSAAIAFLKYRKETATTPDSDRHIIIPKVRSDV